MNHNIRLLKYRVRFSNAGSRWFSLQSYSLVQLLNSWEYHYVICVFI